jgi:hypothetical protein
MLVRRVAIGPRSPILPQAGRTGQGLRSGCEVSYDICGLSGAAAFLMIFQVVASGEPPAVD